jgi:hypothetical protein
MRRHGRDGPPGRLDACHRACTNVPMGTKIMALLEALGLPPHRLAVAQAHR